MIRFQHRSFARWIAASVATFSVFVGAFGVSRAGHAATPLVLTVSPSRITPGNVVTFRVTGLDPGAGRVDFSVGSVPIGSVSVDGQGVAQLAGPIWNEGVVTASWFHWVNGAEVRSTVTGSISFGSLTSTTSGVPTTSTTTTTILSGSISTANQYYTSAVHGSITGNTTRDPLGQLYVVVPTAPLRAYADFVVLCDGSPTVTVDNRAATVGGNQACFGNPGRHAVTVTDKLGQYGSVTVPWQATRVNGPGFVPEGRDVVISNIGVGETPANEPARNIQMPGATCTGNTCTIPGSALVYSFNPAFQTITFGYQYQTGSLTAVGSFIVTVTQAPTTSTTSSTTTTLPSTTTTPVSSSIFFAVTRAGFASSSGSSSWSGWFGSPAIIDGKITGERSSFGAKLFFDAPLAAAGRIFTISFPVTRLDAARPQPTLYVQAFDAQWNQLTQQVKQCVALAGDTRSSCSTLSSGFVLPSKTVHVLVGLETSGAVQIENGGAGFSNAA